MTISQKSKGPFQTGSQPGCIGFGDNAKSMARAGKYAHVWTRAEVWNFLAEDLFFDGMYPIQTEDTTNNDVHNVIYRNLYCPSGCVSINAYKKIENIIIENVTCDLLRLSVDDGVNNAVLRNASVKNVIMQKLHIYNPHENAEMTFENVIQTEEPRNNAFTQTYCDFINANAVFTNCIFTALSSEQNGVWMRGGVRRFINCVFNMYDKTVTLYGDASETNHDIAENCTFNSVSDSTENTIYGYGKNNIWNATKLKSALWGDMFYTFEGSAYTGAEYLSNTHPNCVIVSGDKLRYIVFAVISNTNSLLTVPLRTRQMPIYKKIIPVTIVSTATSASGTNETVRTYATINNSNGIMSVAYPLLADKTDYNRIIIDTYFELLRRPTLAEIRAFLS